MINYSKKFINFFYYYYNMLNPLSFNYNSDIILITAPHTIYTKRLNKIHYVENNIKNILRKINNNNLLNFSTLTWNIESDKNNLIYDDPNYLNINDFQNNLFFKNIKYYNNIFNFKYILDLHGMKNSHNYDIIIGTESIKKNYSNDFYNRFINLLYLNLNNLSNKYNLKIGYNNKFHGYINETFLTISQQSIFLNIIPIQIELSYDFRCRLLKNDNLFYDFFNVFQNVLI